MRSSLDPAGRLTQQTLGWAGFYSAAMQRKLLTPVGEGRRNQTDSTAVLTRPLNRGSLTSW